MTTTEAATSSALSMLAVIVMGALFAWGCFHSRWKAAGKPVSARICSCVVAGLALNGALLAGFAVGLSPGVVWWPVVAAAILLIGLVGWLRAREEIRRSARAVPVAAPRMAAARPLPQEDHRP